MKNGQVKCGLCGEILENGLLLKHLSQEHNLDVMQYMKFWKTWRGMVYTFIVFSIGAILGILVRGAV